jgi:hypothetical protein
MPKPNWHRRALALLLALFVVLAAQPVPSRAAEGVPPDLEVTYVGTYNGNEYLDRVVQFRVTNVGNWWVGETTATVEIQDGKTPPSTVAIRDLDPKGQEGENPSFTDFVIPVTCAGPSLGIKVTLEAGTDWAGDVETNLKNNTVTGPACPQIGTLTPPQAPKPGSPKPAPPAQPAPKPAPAPPGSKTISLSPSATRAVEVYRTHDTLSGWDGPKAIGNVVSDTPVAGWGQDEDGGHIISSTGSWVYQTAVQFTAANPLEAGKATNITRATVTFGEAALYWTSGSGADQDKPDGCVVVRVPSVDWVKSPPALLIPFITDARSPAPRKLGPREWDVTQAFRWQYDPSNRGIVQPGTTGAPIGFGFLLTGEPDLNSLEADDDTRCTSYVSDIKLNLTFTVEDPGKDDLVVR